MALYRFVHYLTYISNGSPKKLTLFFEKNVRQGTYLKQEDKIGDVRYYRNGELQPASPKDDEAFYLSFGYYTQEKINFIHYLTYPIMQSLINRSNLYGDKLLVSASFLISHLFKLHNCGFSWRNLEQVPELLEINKTPEMREYIGSIIDFMNHTHLTTIPFGLYHYKFPMKISEEISFHSKLSGEVSALFNFSQDDIRGIREHYIRLIKGNGTENDATRYARASVHHTLGDLSMMEENYSNAIFEYEKSLEIISPFIEELKAGGGKIQDMNYIAFLNRTMLKLGLAHETRRTDNSAFILYTELAQTLQELSDYVYGNIDDPLALCIFPETNNIKGNPNELGIKLDLLEYLITDGIFCLSRILELIIPLRNTTLFSNSFKADIYTHLVRFNMLYRLLYCYYYYGCNPEHDKQMDEFLKRRNKYRKVSWNSSCSTKLKPLRPAGNFLARRIALFMEVKRVTRKNNPTHTHVNFLAENGIHYYTKARQLHLQGKSYQELIRNLFFLDDDLKNDTLQFYMAMERFEIAHGKQSRKENRLKRRYSDNIAYQIDKYLGL